MRAMQHVKQCSRVFLIFYEQNHPKTTISAVLFYQIRNVQRVHKTEYIILYHQHYMPCQEFKWLQCVLKE